MAYVIAEPCVDVKDKSCQVVCPVDCIYEGARKLYIHPGECIDCNACLSVCPVDAIFFEDDLPPKWETYNLANTEFFADVDTSGGATVVGPRNLDAAIVASAGPRIGETYRRDKPPPIWRTLGTAARQWLR